MDGTEGMIGGEDTLNPYQYFSNKLMGQCCMGGLLQYNKVVTGGHILVFKVSKQIKCMNILRGLFYLIFLILIILEPQEILYIY